MFVLAFSILNALVIVIRLGLLVSGNEDFVVNLWSPKFLKLSIKMSLFSILVTTANVLYLRDQKDIFFASLLNFGIIFFLFISFFIFTRFLVNLEENVSSKGYRLTKNGLIPMLSLELKKRYLINIFHYLSTCCVNEKVHHKWIFSFFILPLPLL